MSNRRVVITGTGLITALGTGTEKNWQALLAGKSGIAPITRFDAEQARHPHRRRGEGLRARAVHRQARGPPDGPLRPVRHGRRRDGDEGERPARRAGQAPRLRRRAGRASSSARASAASPRSRSSTSKALEKGFDRLSPFFIIQMIINLAPGPDLHPLRRQGPELVAGVGLRHRAHAIGEACEVDPARRGRRDDRRRRRGDHHPAGHRRLRGDEGAVHAQRRPGRRPAARSTRTATAS